MKNIDKYNNAFTTSLSISDAELGDGLLYQSIPSWDSIGHMTLIAALEEVFDIMLDTDDIISFSSYNKGKEILAKYEVNL